MIREEQFPQPGFIDIFDELIAAQHFFGLAAMLRDAGRELEASDFDAICTRHWQRAGWIVEARLVAARAAVNNPPAEPTPEAESGSASQNETPTEAPVTDIAAAILPEVWPVLRARHLAGTVDELPPVGGTLEELPVDLTPYFPSDSQKPEKVH